MPFSRSKTRFPRNHLVAGAKPWQFWVRNSSPEISYSLLGSVWRAFQRSTTEANKEQGDLSIPPPIPPKLGVWLVRVGGWGERFLMQNFPSDLQDLVLGGSTLWFSYVPGKANPKVP